VLFVDDTRALVAVAHPDDKAMLATIGAKLSREIVPYVALTLPLHRALEEAYAARKAGKEEYYGRHARTAENRSTLLALATYVPKDRPDDDAAVFTDDAIRDASEGETASMREVDATSDAPPESPPSVDLERLLTTGARAFREGRQTEGIEMLARAARAHPRSFQAAYQLGLMLGQAGRVHEAISHVEHATTLDPASFAATKNLAILQEKAGFRGRAVEAWTVARALAPDAETRARIESHLAKLAGG
jgi:Flp pilus assembly protein TadD